jgi:hypothetical protein
MLKIAELRKIFLGLSFFQLHIFCEVYLRKYRICIHHWETPVRKI